MAIATGAAYFFGASMALGAFLAGMVVGQSPVSQQAAADALPLRDAFGVLFFVSVGMLFDPGFLLREPAPRPRRARRRARGQAPRRDRGGGAPRLLRAHRSRGRDRARADRRVLVHPRAARPPPRPPARRRGERARGLRPRLDLASTRCSSACSTLSSAGSARHPAPLAAAERARGAPRRDGEPRNGGDPRRRNGVPSPSSSATDRSGRASTALSASRASRPWSSTSTSTP